MSKIKAWLKKQIPSKEQLEQNRFIKPFAPTLRKSPNYWQFNRSSVTRGCAIAVFGAFMPIPFQMVIALILSLPLQANLILSLGLLWISNPITIAPMYFLCYEVGAWVLRVPTEKMNIHLTGAWITHELAHIWEPFLLGCLICGAVFSAITYVFVFFIWKYVNKYFHKRK